jgi:hypothetical protein
MSIQDTYDVYETSSDPDRITIVVYKGKAGGNLIIHKEEHNDYGVAMERLRKLEASYGSKYWIDVRDKLLTNLA